MKETVTRFKVDSSLNYIELSKVQMFTTELTPLHFVSFIRLLTFFSRLLILLYTCSDTPKVPYFGRTC